MKTRVRNRLLLFGVLWGLVLSVPPALTMTDPYQLTGLLVTGLACAALSGCAGTLVSSLLLSPIFGTVVNRTGKNAAGEKEDLVVR